VLIIKDELINTPMSHINHRTPDSIIQSTCYFILSSDFRNKIVTSMDLLSIKTDFHFLHVLLVWSIIPRSIVYSMCKHGNVSLLHTLFIHKVMDQSKAMKT